MTRSGLDESVGMVNKALILRPDPGLTMDSTISLTTALSLCGAAIVLAAFCGWRGAQPVNPRKGPRLIPWRALMVIFAFAAVLAIWEVGQVLHIKAPS